MKKTAILLLLSISLSVSARKFYVSSSDGNDSDSGLTEALAWASLSKVNSTTFVSGDSVLFKRGDTFRGSIYQTENGTASARILYGTYGTGAKPLILGSKDLSSTGDWTLNSGNVWRTTATLGTNQGDISNLIFNSEASCGMKRKSIDSLNAQGKFFYNTSNNLVYLYSTQNPASYYTKIEAAGHHDISQGLLYWINSSYITVQNLDVRYSSAAGIEFRACSNLIVEDCDPSFIGGEYVDPAGASLIRLGNGISFVQNNDQVVVRRCRPKQCYDAGISPQAWSASVMTNMDFYDNVISNCWYSFETWSTTGYTLSNIRFHHNTCVDAGVCWSNSIYQRPDLNNASHVIMWALTGTATNITVMDNIFSNSTNFALRLDDNVNKLIVDYNLFDCDTVGYTAETTKYITLSAWQSAMSQDSHSKSGDPLFVSSSDFRLQASSPAKDSGASVGVNTDYLNVIRGYLPDIGAYEYEDVRYLTNGSGRYMRQGGTFKTVRR